jgi:hypothetical protein
MDVDRLETLLQRHFDQVLKPEERRELSRLLLESARAREFFWESARLNALLRQWGESEWGRKDAESGVSATEARGGAREILRSKVGGGSLPRKSRVRSIGWRLGAASGVFAALLLFFSLRLMWKKDDREPDFIRPGVALLTRASEAQWLNPSDAYLPGQVLRAGWVRLKAGAIQLEFIRGARVILEGPVELQLISENECRLHSGKLRAYVPEPAHGFLVRSNGFDVTDLGTEFGCSVRPGEASEVHVFDGLVSLELAGHPELGRQLHEKQALWIDQERVRDIPIRPDGFLSDAELAQRELADAKTRMTEWKQESRRFIRHPSVLMYLDFESTQPWARSLDNLARRGLLESNASIIGCESVLGRWPNKGALQFEGPDDRLRFSLPGLHRSMSLLAWVRIDRLEEGQTCLLMTEGKLPGEFEWYLTGDGRLGFGLRREGDDLGSSWRSHSPRVIGAGNFGSWMLVGAVLDGASKTLTHYVNGRPVGLDEFEHDTAVRIGTVEVGNAGGGRGINREVTTPGDVVTQGGFQPFQGRMDELAILSDPLHATEIRQFYMKGWPGNPGSLPREGDPALQTKTVR